MVDASPLLRTWSRHHVREGTRPTGLVRVLTSDAWYGRIGARGVAMAPALLEGSGARFRRRFKATGFFVVGFTPPRPKKALLPPSPKREKEREGNLAITPNPTMASSLPPRSSYLKKEIAGMTRREMGFKVTPRRNVLLAINKGEAPSTSADGGGGSGTDAAPVVEFSGREDVERLLAEKMKGKSKIDYKGRVEQMSDYIKKLRACIRWYMDLENGYLVEQEELCSAMDAENTSHTELDCCGVL